MAEYRKKPIVIEAVQLTGTSENLGELADFMGEVRYNPNEEQAIIETLEGEMRANHGDWIIKGVSGEFYPCKPEIFEKTYDVVER